MIDFAQIMVVLIFGILIGYYFGYKKGQKKVENLNWRDIK